MEFLWLSLFLKIDKQNIIYTRSAEIAWLFGARGYKAFFECHQLPEKKSKLFGYFFKKIHGIVTITNGLKHDLVADYALSADKILTAPDGVDLETFDIKITRQEAREQLNLPSDKKIVLYTGHLFTWKGVGTLAEASRKLPEEIQVYALGGDEKEIDVFNKRNLGHQVMNIPSVPREMVAIWLKVADLLVLPNSAKEKISEKYTSPLKLFEYMASGLAIAASNNESLRSIIEDNCIGLCADDDTVENFAKKIDLIISDLNSLRMRKKRSFDLFTTKYSYQKINYPVINEIVEHLT